MGCSHSHARGQTADRAEASLPLCGALTGKRTSGCYHICVFGCEFVGFEPGFAQSQQCRLDLFDVLCCSQATHPSMGDDPRGLLCGSVTPPVAVPIEVQGGV